ncbi:MAG: nuclease PIN, partial [Pseudomonadales bacterium]
MSIYDTSKLPPFSLLNEPELTFNPEDTALDVNPLRGLDRYGGYSSAVFSVFTPELRIATIGPASGRRQLRGLIEILRSTQAPSDRKQYVPMFRGFEHSFGVPLV